MADHFDISVPECKNYLTTARWLVYTGNCLEQYTRDGIQDVYQDIYGRLAHLPLCVDRCSELYGYVWPQWCHTCREWKGELLRVRRQPDVKWNKTESWMWPKQYENITEVFAPPFRRGGSATFKDVSFLCSSWDNCRGKFHVKKNIIKRLRNERNKLSHNSLMRVSNDDKNKLFDVLVDLFHDKDIQPHVNTGDCIRHLRAVEVESYGDDVARNLVHNVQNDLRHLRNEQKDMTRYLEQLNKRIYKMQMIRKKNRRNFWIMLAFLSMCALFISWHGITTTVPRENHTTDNYSLHGFSKCSPDENYRYPIVQDFPLTGYINGRRELLGRQWVFDDLEPYIFRTTNSSGVILIADIGYGKSAIVSHILCSQKSVKGSSIRKHVVAFHVCRFDVKSTRSGERFIRRLIGFFASKNAEYGSIIAYLSNESIIYDRDKCAKELEACFDQGIVFPLREIDIPSDGPWLLVIDALDECADITLKDNAIMNILKRGLKKLPSWIKVIITSREIDDLHKLRALDRMYLEANDPRNIDDIHLFIQNKLNDKSNFDEVVEMCQGNFQFATHLIIHLSRYENVKEITFPKTLNEIYEDEFERLFPTDNSFESTRRILEVLCTTLRPLTKSELLMMIPYLNDDLTNELRKLSFYVKTHNDKQLIFVHQSISEWLLSGNSPRFAIKSENGHQTISSFMIKSLNTSLQVDVVDLAIHVAAAANSSTTALFRSIAKGRKFEPDVLHKISWRSNSVNALELMLNVYKDVNSFNSAGITPAFVAASKGHLEQLKKLYKLGADLNFIVAQDFGVFFNDETVDEITLHNDIYYTGYNLLHVATKHGHFLTVEYLVKMNKSLINVRNAVGYRASDIACEKGFQHILEKFASVNRTVIDKHCFYLASKYNRINILEYLIRNNISVDCISYEDLMSLDNILQDRKVKFSSSDHLQWINMKETPLHVALKNRHYEAFNLIVTHFPNLLECIDNLGFTPVLKSIMYNTTDVNNSYIRDRLLSDKCGNRSIPFVTFTESLVGEECPAGASTAHLIALYDRFEIYLSFLSHNIVLDWNAPDDGSMMPVHYASAKGNIRMLPVLSHENVDFTNSKTKNGLTAFHIIAKAGDYVCFYLLTQRCKGEIPILKDTENRSVLHHTVLRDFCRVAETDEKSLAYQYHYFMFKDIVENKRHLLFEVDIYKRNIMHYVLRNGHALILGFLLKENAADVWALMAEYDSFNQTPIAFALNREKDAVFHFPRNCIFTDIFFSHCNISFTKYLYSWEHAIFQLISSSHNGHANKLIVSQLSKIFHSSPYLTTAFVVYNKHVEKSIIKSHILTGFTLGMNDYSLFTIARHRPDTLIECGKPLEASPLHLMALKFPMALTRSHIMSFFHFIFGCQINTTLLSCEDQSGYNLLHYAIKADNPFLSDILLDLGIHILTSRVSFEKLVWMVLLTTPKNTSNGGIVNTEMTNVSSDDILVKLFRKSSASLHEKRIPVCRNLSMELSIVHFLAINNFVKTITFINKIYGNRVISCMNIDGFTPLYFAKIFNQSNVHSYLKGRTTLSMPTRLAESHLTFNIDANFPFVFGSSIPVSSTYLSIQLYAEMLINKKYDVHQQLDYPFACLKEKLNLKHERIYKQRRMLECISNVFIFCKSILINDSLSYILLQGGLADAIYSSTHHYIMLKSLLSAALYRDSETAIKDTVNRLLSNANCKDNQFTRLQELKFYMTSSVIYINKRISTLLLLSKLGIPCICSCPVGRRITPFLDTVGSLYLQTLQETAIQLSIRVMLNRFRRGMEINDFVHKRLVALDLVLQYDKITKGYEKYTKQYFLIGRTISRYRYLNVIYSSKGFLEYYALRMSSWRRSSYYVPHVTIEHSSFEVGKDLSPFHGLNESTNIN